MVYFLRYFLFFACAASVQFCAAEESPWYIENSVNTSGEGFGSSLSESGNWGTTLAVGRSFDSNWRAQAEMTKYGDVDFNDIQKSEKLTGFSASTFYDFDNRSDWTPYVGAKLNRYLNDKYDAETKTQDSTSGIGYSAVTGLRYQGNSPIGVNLGLEYGQLTSEKNEYGTKLGFFYRF